LLLKKNLLKKTGIKIHGTGDKKEKNTDNKPEGDNDKKKTRENMLAKLKLGKKKDPTKKK